MAQSILASVSFLVGQALLFRGFKHGIVAALWISGAVLGWLGFWYLAVSVLASTPRLQALVQGAELSADDITLVIAIVSGLIVVSAATAFRLLGGAGGRTPATQRLAIGGGLGLCLVWPLATGPTGLDAFGLSGLFWISLCVASFIALTLKV